MKKRLILGSFMMLYLGIIFAQSISPAAVVPDGAVSETANISLEWTIGEVIMQTVKHNEGILTQGSHQPILQVDLIQSKALESGIAKTEIQVYPNPVERMINIHLSSDEHRELDIKLIDLHGKILLSQTGNAASDQLQMDMNQLPPGLYLLHFQEKDGTIIRNYKVTKATNR